MMHMDLLKYSRRSYLSAEFDALTGSKIASIDLGHRVVRMAYSPTTSHIVIAILEVCLCASPFPIHSIHGYNCEAPFVISL
jgi:hypothetical protein